MHMCGSTNAVLEANAKVNGRAPFSDSHLSQTHKPILMLLPIYYCVHKGSQCAKFGWDQFSRYYAEHT